MTETKRKTVGEYDPTANALLQPGIYPAHIIAVTIKDNINTKIGNANIYNIDYKFADEIEKLEQFLYVRGSDGNFVADETEPMVTVKDSDGEATRISCAFAKGRVLRFHSVWLFNDAQGKGSNGGYETLMDVAGLEAKKIKLESGIEIKQLVEIYPEDLIGKPVMIEVGMRPSPTKETKELPKDQWEYRYWPQVTMFYKWGSGKALTGDDLPDDLPF